MIKSQGHLFIVSIILSMLVGSCAKKQDAAVTPLLPAVIANAPYRVDSADGIYKVESLMDVWDVNNQVTTTYKIAYYPDSTISMIGLEYTLIDHFDFKSNTAIPFAAAVNYSWHNNNTGKYAYTDLHNKNVVFYVTNDSLIITGQNSKYCASEMEIDTFRGAIYH